MNLQVLDGAGQIFWEKLLVPLVLALVSWLLKDYALGAQKQREEVTRAEWKYRLTEVWEPLFYWSGVIHFVDGKQGWERYGAKELGQALTKAAHLLPLNYYYVLVRVLENATDQKTARVLQNDLDGARNYVYGQIEILNHALYGQYSWFDPANGLDMFASARLFLRAMTEISIHLVVWLSIGAVLFLIYWGWDVGFRWAPYIAVTVVVVFTLFEVRRRVRLRRAFLRRAKG